MSVRSSPRRLTDCHNIADLRALAQQRMPGPLFHYLEGAAETEQTAQRNTSSFDAVPLVPRCLRDVSAVKTTTRLLGREIAWPVLCSPTGASRFFHPQGELAVARAAERAGTLYGLSCMSTFTLEQVAAASRAPKLFQLYVFRDRDFTRELIERCKRASYDALCVTVDTAVPGNRERDLRTGLGVPPRLSVRLLASFARHPRWLLGQMHAGRLALPNVAQRTGSRTLRAHSQFFGEQLDPALSWKDVREIADMWGGPLALKGVLSPDDARRAVDEGVTAIIVSNHGGRQLDGAAAPFEMLPEIVRAVGDRAEIILDGGVRRGVHVLKALARGARACSIGRPYLFGLGAGGEAGVARALAILRGELSRAMQLSGCNDVLDVDPELLKGCRGPGEPQPSHPGRSGASVSF